MTCAVDTCNNRRRDNVSRYRFPKNPKLRSIWQAFCGEGSRINSTDWNWDRDRSKDPRMCAKHFAPSCFRNPNFTQLGLKPNAYPTRKHETICSYEVSYEIEELESSSNFDDGHKSSEELITDDTQTSSTCASRASESSEPEPEKPRICRICLQAAEAAAVELFEDTTCEGYANLAEVVGTICDVVISPWEEPGLPRWCCEECQTHLQAAYRLRKLCQETDRQLRGLDDGSAKSENGNLFCLEVEMIPQSEEVDIVVESSAETKAETHCNSKRQGKDQIEVKRNIKCERTASFQKDTCSLNEEAVIVNWLKAMHQKGFPITLENIQCKVRKIVEANPEKVALHGIPPDRPWLEAFCERHPKLATLMQTSPLTASASQRAIKNWFTSFRSFVEKHNLQEVLKSPGRLLIAFGNDFYLNEHPPTKVPLVQLPSTEKNITVLHCVSATTYIHHPEIILHSQRVSNVMGKTVPHWWGVDASEQGSLTTAILVRWITDHIHPALVRKKVKFPVILFLDDKTSSVAFEAADACYKLGIILIALYPGVTQLFQPPELGLFDLIKENWTRFAEEVHQTKGSCTLVEFATFLQRVFIDPVTHSIVKDTFRQCGLFP